MKQIQGGNRTFRRRALSRIVATGWISSLAALSGCRPKPPAPNAAVDPVNAASARAEPLPVGVTPVKIQPMAGIVETTGVLGALRDVTVRVKRAGILAAIYCREGDVVHAGQIVAQQDTMDLQAQLEAQRTDLIAAQTRLSQAMVALADAKTNLKRTEDQVESQIKTAQSERDRALEHLTDLKEAGEAVEISKADLDTALADRDRGRKDLKRYQEMARQGAVSAQRLDQAQAVADAEVARYLSLESRYNAALQGLKKLQESNGGGDVGKARSAADRAKARLNTALGNRGQIDLRRSEVRTAEVNIPSAQAGIAQANATVRLAEQSLHEASITAPIDGIVEERKAQPGMQITLARPDVLRIVSLDDLYFDAQLTKAQASGIRVGQSVAVRVDVLAGKTFQGKVAKFAVVTSPVSRGVSARITLSNSSQLLRPQMFARGRLASPTHRNARVVPRAALMDFTGDTGRVYIVKDGIAETRQVKIGYFNLQTTEILSGLEVGEEVVSVGQNQVQPGDKVKVVNAAPRSPQP